MGNLCINIFVLCEDYNDTRKARPTVTGDKHLSPFLRTTRSGLPEIRPLQDLIFTKKYLTL